MSVDILRLDNNEVVDFPGVKNRRKYVELIPSYMHLIHLQKHVSKWTKPDSNSKYNFYSLGSSL